MQVDRRHGQLHLRLHLDLPYHFVHNDDAARGDAGQAWSTERPRAATGANHVLLPDKGRLKKSEGEVLQLSACVDGGRATDAQCVSGFDMPDAAGPGGAGGACSTALAAVVHAGESPGSFAEVLVAMRDELRRRGYTQEPQLMTSLVVDLDQPFSVTRLLSGVPRPPPSPGGAAAAAAAAASDGDDGGDAGGRPAAVGDAKPPPSPPARTADPAPANPIAAVFPTAFGTPTRGGRFASDLEM